MTDEIEQEPERVVLQTQALGQPTFLIKLGDKYYATAAVWEYDPSAAKQTDEQRFQIKHLVEVFDKGVRDGLKLEAVCVQDYVPLFAGSTKH